MSRLVGILWIFFSAAGLQAQTVDVSEFFRRSLPTDPGLPPAAFPKLRTPFIEAIDLRTETDRFDPSRQEYTGRLQFAPPALGRAQRAMYRTLLEAPDLDRIEARCDRVEELYQAWAELYELDRLRGTVDSLQRVLDDRDRLYGLDVGRLRINYDDLLDLRVAQTDLLLQREELQREHDLLRRAYGLTGDSLTFADLPGPEQIAGLLEAPSAAVPATIERDYELALIDREIALEVAEERGILDFVQFRYRGNPNDEVAERFHLGLAFRLERSGDRHLKVRSLELEREWIETNGTLEDQLRSARRSISRARLSAAMGRYRTVRSALAAEADDLARLARTAALDAAVDPELLLDIEERRLENQLTLIAAEADVLADYLEWRRDRGELCAGDDGRWLRP